MLAPALGLSGDPGAVPGLVSANARLSASDQNVGSASSISLPWMPAAGATTLFASDTPGGCDRYVGTGYCLVWWAVEDSNL